MAADPYATLGITPGASDAELRTAYRRLVQRHHPDHNQGSHESALRFAQVQEAYAHVKLLRKRADAPPGASAGAGGTGGAGGGTGDSDLDRRLAAMEAELRTAREQREQAERARARAQAAAAAATERDRNRGERPSDEELGHVSTDDSFAKIFDDAAERLSARFSQTACDPSRPSGSAPRPRVPKSVADWIDELSSRLTDERPGHTE